MIVKYIENDYNYKFLKPNDFYLVSKIIDNNLFIFGNNRILEKQYFLNEDNTEITIDKYTNPFILTKKNILKDDMVLCINNYNDSRLKIGQKYKIESIKYYGKFNFRLVLDFNVRQTYYFYINNEFEPNMFMKYSVEVKRYIKLLSIFNDIKLY